MSRIQSMFHDLLIHKAVTQEAPPSATPTGTASAIKTVAITRSPETRRVIERIARNAGWELACAESVEEALELKSGKTAVTLVDREMLGADWKDNLARLLCAPYRCCVILMSPSRTDRFSYEFIRYGGYSVLKTPLEDHEASDAVRLAAAFWKACISRH